MPKQLQLTSVHAFYVLGYGNWLISDLPLGVVSPLLLRGLNSGLRDRSNRCKRHRLFPAQHAPAKATNIPCALLEEAIWPCTAGFTPATKEGKNSLQNRGLSLKAAESSRRKGYKAGPEIPAPLRGEKHLWCEGLCDVMPESWVDPCHLPVQPLDFALRLLFCS